MECVVRTTERSADTSEITSHICRRLSGSIPLLGCMRTKYRIKLNGNVKKIQRNDMRLCIDMRRGLGTSSRNNTLGLPIRATAKDNCINCTISLVLVLVGMGTITCLPFVSSAVRAAWLVSISGEPDSLDEVLTALSQQTLCNPAHPPEEPKGFPPSHEV